MLHQRLYNKIEFGCIMGEMPLYVQVNNCQLYPIVSFTSVPAVIFLSAFYHFLKMADIVLWDKRPQFCSQLTCLAYIKIE